MSPLSKISATLFTVGAGLILAYQTWNFYQSGGDIGISVYIYLILTIFAGFYYMDKRDYAVGFAGIGFIILSIIYFFLRGSFSYVQGFIWYDIVIGITGLAIAIENLFFYDPDKYI